MPSTEDRREAVEFPRTHRCADEGGAYRAVGDCGGRMKASGAPFGNDDALCSLDSSGPGMWQKPADPIEGKDHAGDGTEWLRSTRCRYTCDRS